MCMISALNLEGLMKFYYIYSFLYDSSREKKKLEQAKKVKTVLEVYERITSKKDSSGL